MQSSWSMISTHPLSGRPMACQSRRVGGGGRTGMIAETADIMSIPPAENLSWMKPGRRNWK
jgi:hypothetical protein